mmetsp:Transcript_1982/g.5041  ORF Transcript_1982/g.5041 Transcript_1982/m.5041 type:complete len:150 (-) Transcript_1982:186-635(-)
MMLRRFFQATSLPTLRHHVVHTLSSAGKPLKPMRMGARRVGRKWLLSAALVGVGGAIVSDMADEAKASLREKRHELWRGIRALCQKGCESPQDSIVDKMKKRLQEVRELQHHWWQNITDTWRQGGIRRILGIETDTASSSKWWAWWPRH